MRKTQAVEVERKRGRIHNDFFTPLYLHYLYLFGSGWMVSVARPFF